MDICVNTEDINQGINSIGRTVDNLSTIISFIDRKLREASFEFQSINYERTKESIDKANHQLEVMSAKLEMTKDYLNRLNEHVEEYNKYKF